MDGLSADKLRVLLIPSLEDEEDDDITLDYDDDAEDFDVNAGLNRRNGKQRNDKNEGDEEEKEKRMGLEGSMVLATVSDVTRGEWKTAQVMYSYHGRHRVR